LQNNTRKEKNKKLGKNKKSKIKQFKERTKSCLQTNKTKVQKKEETKNIKQIIKNGKKN
jgi:hypothetical protein